MVQAHDILMGKMDLEGSENEEEYDEVFMRVSCVFRVCRMAFFCVDSSPFLGAFCPLYRGREGF